MKHGKKYVESAALVDRLKQYDPMESMELVHGAGLQDRQGQVR